MHAIPVCHTQSVQYLKPFYHRRNWWWSVRNMVCQTNLTFWTSGKNKPKRSSWRGNLFLSLSLSLPLLEDQKKHLLSCMMTHRFSIKEKKSFFLINLIFRGLRALSLGDKEPSPLVKAATVERDAKKKKRDELLATLQEVWNCALLLLRYECGQDLFLICWIMKTLTHSLPPNIRWRKQNKNLRQKSKRNNISKCKHNKSFTKGWMK